VILVFYRIIRCIIIVKIRYAILKVRAHLYTNRIMIMVWLVEHLPVICLKEDDSNYPPLEKVEPNRKYIKTFGSTFSKGGKR